MGETVDGTGVVGPLVVRVPGASAPLRLPAEGSYVIGRGADVDLEATTCCPPRCDGLAGRWPLVSRQPAAAEAFDGHAHAAPVPDRWR